MTIFNSTIRFYFSFKLCLIFYIFVVLLDKTCEAENTLYELIFKICILHLGKLLKYLSENIFKEFCLKISI